MSESLQENAFAAMSRHKRNMAEKSKLDRQHCVCVDRNADEILH